ncbi:MAG: hypothetical protein O2951_09555 [Bacteroidetes bacterium]|nr:hypothetical protein [Bacteroidota bacterium]
MGLFSNLFKSKKDRRHFSPDFKPITGGDATSIETSAIIHCLSMGMANSLIDRFISERHGTVGEDWKRSLEHFVVNDRIISGVIRCIIITSKKGNMAYYFNVSRPMQGTLKVIELLNK